MCCTEEEVNGRDEWPCEVLIEEEMMIVDLTEDRIEKKEEVEEDCSEAKEKKTDGEGAKKETDALAVNSQQWPQLQIVVPGTSMAVPPPFSSAPDAVATTTSSSASPLLLSSTTSLTSTSMPSSRPLPPSSVPHLLPRLPIAPTAQYNALNSSNYASRSSSTLPHYSYGSWPTIRLSLINTQEFTARASSVVSKEIISTLKLVGGVRFDRSIRKFIFPISSHGQLVTALGAHKVHVEPLPQESRNRLSLQKRMESSFSSDEFESILHAKLPRKLLDALASFQREGVRFVYKNKGRAIIADEMGLGKTIQAIACAGVYQENWPVLIVVPSSARHHWKMELETWLCPSPCSPDDIVLIDAPSKVDHILHKQHSFAIISYNYLSKLEDVLCSKKYRMMIIDESHFLKNGKAKRTQCMSEIARSAVRMVLLTGTPALSRPFELFPQLKLIAPMSWNSEQNFCKRYCRGGEAKSGWNNGKGGASHTEELHATLFGTIMIRRLKKDMLTSLPLKSRRIERIEVLDETVRDELLSMLKQISASKSSKLGGKCKFVDEFLKDATAPDSAGDSNEHKEPEYSVARETPSIVHKPDFSLPPSVYPKTAVASANATALGNGSNNGGDNDEKVKIDSNSNSTDMNGEAPSVSGADCGEKGIDVDDLDRPVITKRMMLMELFNRSGIAKVSSVLQHVEAFLSDPMSGKLLIFAHHKNVLDSLSKYLASRREGFIRIDGSTPSKSRHDKMLQFQSVPSCRVAVLAITAAGVAITLTAANTVFFAELYWTPGSLLQAEDRVHRIGQLSAVEVKYFLGRGTVDELLWPLIQKKMKTLGEVFEGERNAEMAVSQSQGVSQGVDREEVAEMVENISLEEERNLIRQQVEEADDEITADRSSNVSISSSGSHESISSAVGEDDEGSEQTALEGIEEYDGLAEAMMNPRELDNGSKAAECFTIGEEDEDEEVATRIISFREKQGAWKPPVVFVDLVEDNDEQCSSSPAIFCVDSDDNDNNDEVKDSSGEDPSENKKRKAMGEDCDDTTDNFLEHDALIAKKNRNDNVQSEPDELDAACFDEENL